MSWTDTLDNLISTAGDAYGSYQSSQTPPTFTPLAPGSYVGPNGTVITANSPITSPTSMFSLLLVAAVFVFAFMWLRK